MKIGILTFHASHNYGSMLQAYALQTCLTSMGHEVLIINLRILAQKSKYSNPVRFNTKASLRYLLHPVLFYQNIRKWHKFESFMIDNYNLTKECHCLVDVERVINEQRFDSIISGGDQIWNMDAQDFSIAYYLPFESRGFRKISYAPSFGSGEKYIPSNYSNAIKNLLLDYDNLSVRDNDSSIFLSSLLGKDVPEMTDPAFLLEKAFYDSFAGETPLIKGKYIFYYSPTFKPELEKVALSFAKSKNIPIYTSNGSSTQCKDMKRKQDIGPKEFLNLLKYADIVCGKSFHLVVFSLILHKQFFSITGNTDTRMKGLLTRCRLMDHAFSPASKIEDIALSTIDWSSVDRVLAEMKEIGTNYLFNALK